jgi:hypothetical protein
MSRRGAWPEGHGVAVQVNCLRELAVASGFQREIARETLLNIASVFMTRRFSTPC